MRGKAGFILGAAVGYVLGTRAGRARYEQIKRGANAVWETPLVQQGVASAKASAGDALDVAKSAALNLAKTVFDAATQQQGKPQPGSARPAPPARRTAVVQSGGTAEDPAEEKTE